MFIFLASLTPTPDRQNLLCTATIQIYLLRLLFCVSHWHLEKRRHRLPVRAAIIRRSSHEHISSQTNFSGPKSFLALKPCDEDVAWSLKRHLLHALDNQHNNSCHFSEGTWWLTSSTLPFHSCRCPRTWFWIDCQPTAALQMLHIFPKFLGSYPVAPEIWTSVGPKSRLRAWLEGYFTQMIKILYSDAHMAKNKTKKCLTFFPWNIEFIK